VSAKVIEFRTDLERIVRGRKIQKEQATKGGILRHLRYGKKI
jgi:hypothetical protein